MHVETIQECHFLKIIIIINVINHPKKEIHVIIQPEFGVLGYWEGEFGVLGEELIN